MKVEKFTPLEWKNIAPLAHKIAFDEILLPEKDRIDFALLASKDGAPTAYVTCREVDADSLYWAYGGSMPNAKDTVLSWSAYVAMTEACRKYQRIFTLIENNNLVMLKFAMKIGYRIIGIKNYKGTVLLEHCLEF